MRIDKLICLIALILLELPSVIFITRAVLKRRKETNAAKKE